MSFNDEDFKHLICNATTWGEWAKEQEGRFLPIPKYTWKYVYFFDHFLSMKVAQAYIGDECSCHFDECSDDSRWVILTDFDALGFDKL